MGKDLKGKELGRGLTQRPDGRIWRERRLQEKAFYYMVGN